MDYFGVGVFGPLDVLEHQAHQAQQFSVVAKRLIKLGWCLYHVLRDVREYLWHKNPESIIVQLLEDLLEEDDIWSVVGLRCAYRVQKHGLIAVLLLKELLCQYLGQDLDNFLVNARFGLCRHKVSIERLLNLLELL